MNNSFSNKGTTVENFLPREFAYELGLYLQTCAHIELVASALIVCLKGLEPENKDWFDQYCQVRKLPTKDLIKQLKDSSDAAKEFGFSQELSELSDWIKRFVQNRHMAAHGAFFKTRNEFLRVDYVTNNGSKKEPRFKRETNAVTRENVDVVLQDANRIYRIVLEMIGSIKEDLPIRIHLAIVPIVEHPS